MAKKLSPAWVAFLGLMAASALGAGAKSDGVKIIEQENKLRIEINGEFFTEYHFKGAPHVYFYPVIGPGGLPMTRNFPMAPDSEGEEHDHPHQRSMWYSHGEVNGVDFWSEAAKAGKILHDKFLAIESGAESGVIKSKDNWVGPDGQLVCTDERTFRVYARPNTERLFDFEIRLRAGDKELILGDTKEGSLGIRIAETMRLSHGKKAGRGHIVQSTGLRDDETWGKHADWCDYYGPVNDKIVGIAIFDHPKNPRHPTTWHVRDYGLFAANPFGLHDFEKKPSGAGALAVAPGQSVTFRYRIYLHEGDEAQAKVAERYQEYIQGPLRK